MSLLEAIKFSHHNIKSTGEQFRKNLGVRSLEDPKIKPIPKSHLVQVLGHGQYASAITTNKEPQNARKISRGTPDLRQDAYYAYVGRIAADPKAEANPYIPKIYQVKVYETTSPNPESKYFYIVYMERLYHLDQLGPQELIQEILRITKSKLTNRFRAALGQDVTGQLQTLEKGKLIELFVDKIRELKIKDPQMQAAMKLAQSTGMLMDITKHNIMFRRTDKGIQVVLADPVRDN